MHFRTDCDFRKTGSIGKVKCALKCERWYSSKRLNLEAETGHGAKLKAAVVKLVDTPALGAGGIIPLGVRVPSAALGNNREGMFGLEQGGGETQVGY